MSLKVIGSGFGRTGTMSMKEALEVLGLGPCHHMIEVMENPEQLAHWKAIAAGEPINWADVFEGYTSQVDWPGAHVWHETSITFPDARVVHTERPEDDWWESFNNTIGKFFAIGSDLDFPPHIADIFETMNGWFMKETFDDFTDRNSAIAAYRLNNER
ncbi:MAG: sulfotransferase family protein, partial [Candidatus Poribacteria bacterium]